ncbi:MAG: hypothetical protein P3A32_08290 [Gemmatimonadota bacterium]|nr:hypothetical protein [Gemmatimonadota bacterium]MDQ8149803.1 hypothetical protein [Gemmatimonadota bacterium]MDQ8157429.1 hypothetical protein [Gemmatimonadota bacterium]MDQ8177036.1 hypothetical protein [Gemmatimonadota bacterium]
MLLAALSIAQPTTAGAQPPAPIAGAAATTTAAEAAAPQDPRALAQQAQADFERVRRLNLPRYRGKVPTGRACPEPVGLNWCYWYDETNSMPPEPDTIARMRDRLLRTLDSLGTLEPGDNWISGQRVRYEVEANRPAKALEVARACRTVGWWCEALAGLSLHEMGRYADAEATFERVLASMSERDRCEWRDLTPYLDEDTRRVYIRTRCGTPERAAYEARVWWFARTRYGMPGNDSRTEHFSRLTYAFIMRDAASAYARGFDEAERELLVRFGWPRQWATEGVAPGGRPMFTGADDPSLRVNVIGAEPTPAHRFIPPANVLTSPAASDSTEWAVQRPPVVARYHPKYASKLLMLEHQQGLFRRGDTALVVLAYDVSKVPGLAGQRLDGALVLTPGTTPAGQSTIRRDIPARGTLTVRAPWGPLLMSAEIAADSASTLVRARYGVRPPFAVGARVSLSDLVFFRPFGADPTTVEEVLPHLLATQKVRAREKVGIYWEAYNTNPAGEPMTISLVVAPDDTEPEGRASRAARALRLGRGADPVSLSVQDRSARGVRVTPRSVEVDLASLRPGDYLVQLEIDVAGQYTVRADRRITVIP